MEKLHATVKRPLTLFSVTAWQQGYSTYIQEAFDWNYSVYFYFDGVNVNFYHTEKDFEHFKKVVALQLISNSLLFEHMNAVFLREVEELKSISIVESTLPRMWELIGRIMSFYIFIVSDSFVHAVPEAWGARIASERILYEVDAAVEDLFKNKLLENGYNPALAQVLTESDFHAIETRTLDVDALTLRLKEYGIKDDVLFVGLSFAEFCQQYNLFLEEEGIVEELKGSSAFCGKVSGKVVLVLTQEDASRVKEGDIMVSIMTNATHLPAMARAAAIVTDEGGITCHASIAARELKKPCVVGTKFATKVLKEGELVEVDADQGVVRKIL